MGYNFYEIIHFQAEQFNNFPKYMILLSAVFSAAASTCPFHFFVCIIEHLKSICWYFSKMERRNTGNETYESYSSGGHIPCIAGGKAVKVDKQKKIWDSSKKKSQQQQQQNER